MRVLSIDFDYFQAVSKELIYNYPDGHDLNSQLSTIIWASNIAYKPELENVGLMEDEFQNILQILKNQRYIRAIQISQSHKDIYDFIKAYVDGSRLSITNIDMHHDMFNNNPGVDCGNWVSHILKEYPDTRYNWICNPISKEVYGLKEDGRFDMVKESLVPILTRQYDYIFLCRSNQWLPPHLDNRFDELKEALIQNAYRTNIFYEGRISSDVRNPRNYKRELERLSEINNAFSKNKKQKYLKESSKMRKIIKVKPSVPNRDFIHYGLLDDNCYGCKNKNGCNHCPRARAYLKKLNKKRIKNNRRVLTKGNKDDLLYF